MSAIARPKTRRMTWPLTGALGNDPAESRATVGPVVFDSLSQPYFTALQAAGLTLSDGRKYNIDRQIKKLRRLGLHTKVDIACALSIDAFAVPMLGNYGRVKIGSNLAFSNNAVTSSNIDSCYEWDLQLKDIDPHDHTIAFFARSGVGNTNSDQGALDAALSVRLAINARRTTNLFSGASFTAAVDMGTTAQTIGSGFCGLTRHPSTPGQYTMYTAGIKRAIQVTAATTGSTSANKIRDLQINGGSTPSSRAFAYSVVGKGLTDAEMCDVYTVIRALDNCFQYGEPQIQDNGYGDANPKVDVLIRGVTKSAVICAYRLTQLGYKVALSGTQRDTSPEHIGFEPVGRIDMDDFALRNGLGDAILTRANALAGLTDSVDANGSSIHPAYGTRVCMQMLDPNLVGLGGRVGKDVIVRLGETVASVVKQTTAIGSEVSSVTMTSGRKYEALNGRMFMVGADYLDAAHLPLMGISYIKGIEARGAAPGENLNGFNAASLFSIGDFAGNTYEIDPTDAFGLLPGIFAIPSVTDGAAWAANQARCLRMMVTTAEFRRAPLCGGYAMLPSANYDPRKFEILGKLYAAYTAAGRTPGRNDVIGPDNSISGSGGVVFDWNSGPSSLSTDFMGLLAGDYLNASGDAARRAVDRALYENHSDFFYWHDQSGDSRIGATLINGLRAYGLDTIYGVDPYPGDPYFLPPAPYNREIVHQMVNAFGFNGNDTFATDGSALRSNKTIACGDYRADWHMRMMVVNGSGKLRRLMALNDNSAGGVNERSPIPVESVLPNKAECTNFISITAPAWSKVATASCRMAHVYEAIGEASAYMIDLAMTGNVALHDISYTTLRTNMLAAPDGTTYVLPQVA